jgi:hypothetical protein
VTGAASFARCNAAMRSDREVFFACKLLAVVVGGIPAFVGEGCEEPLLLVLSVLSLAFESTAGMLLLVPGFAAASALALVLGLELVPMSALALMLLLLVSSLLP